MVGWAKVRGINVYCHLLHCCILWLSFFFSAQSLKHKSTDRHVTPL